MSGGTWRITAGDSAAGYVDVQPQLSYATVIHSWISAEKLFGRQWKYARMVAFADKDGGRRSRVLFLQKPQQS